MKKVIIMLICVLFIFQIVFAQKYNYNVIQVKPLNSNSTIHILPTKVTLLNITPVKEFNNPRNITRTIVITKTRRIKNYNFDNVADNFYRLRIWDKNFYDKQKESSFRSTPQYLQYKEDKEWLSID